MPRGNQPHTFARAGGRAVAAALAASIDVECRAVQSGGALTPGDVEANDQDAAAEREAEPLRRPLPTPWGRADRVEAVGDAGIVSVSTPSHGGYFVPFRLLAHVPMPWQEYAEKWSGSPNWYEEDLAWAAVALSFPNLFSTAALEHARETAARWLPGLPSRAATGDTKTPRLD